MTLVSVQCHEEISTIQLSQEEVTAATAAIKSIYQDRNVDMMAFNGKKVLSSFCMNMIKAISWRPELDRLLGWMGEAVENAKHLHDDESHFTIE
jgi:hypothetical protein